jgi:hypothetical protein
MNLARLNFFDETNAATLCAASAAAYLDFPDCFRETSTDTQVHITSSETDVIVAFRGTIDVRNWITDLDCTWVLEEGCRIHRGFARALDSAQAQLDAEVFSARSTGRRVWLTGHSLGGALAMLCAWRFFERFHEMPFCGVYTFGQPRAGNAAFRESYNFNRELFGRTFRVVHSDDIVPRLPWLMGVYRHAGHEVFFTEGGSKNTGRRSQKPEVRSRKSDARSRKPEFRIDPSIGFKVPFDARNAWRGLCRGKLALLADHHVDSYLELFHRGSVNTFSRAEGFQSGRVCR